MNKVFQTEKQDTKEERVNNRISLKFKDEILERKFQDSTKIKVKFHNKIISLMTFTMTLITTILFIWMFLLKAKFLEENNLSLEIITNKTERAEIKLNKSEIYFD